MLDDLAVLDAENIDDRPAAILFVRFRIQMKNDEVGFLCENTT